MTPKIDLHVDAREMAIDVLTGKAAAHDDFADIHHKLGLLHYLGGDPRRACECHERAMAINPRYSAASSALGYALERAGDRERAFEHWRTACEREKRRPGEHVEVALDLAVAHARRGDLEAGLGLLETLSGEGRHRNLLLRERLLILVAAGRSPEAEGILSQLAEASDRFTHYLVEGGVLADQGLIAEGAAQFLKARECNHNLAEIHTYLGLTYAGFGERAKAQVEFAAGLAANFDLAAYHSNVGRLHSLAGDDERAAAEFVRALAADPTHVQTRIDLGFELATLGQTKAAIEQFAEAARLAPEYADVQFQIGLLYYEMGELPLAEESFKRALELNPDFAIARASLARLHARNGRDAEALAEYKRVLRGGLRSADIYLAIALIHLRDGDSERAAKALRRGARLNPHYPPIHYHLGRIYQARGEKGRAYQSWRRFLNDAEETNLADPIELFRGEMGREARLPTHEPTDWPGRAGSDQKEVA